MHIIDYVDLINPDRKRNDNDHKLLAVLKKVITHKSKGKTMIKEGPESILIEAFAGTQSGAIERQEARGQTALCESKTQMLSAEINPWGYSPFRQDDKDPKDILRAWGIEVGEPVEGDEIFLECKLPKGWQLRPTSHSMWNELVDDQGRVRASMFYKAAFYDRSTHLQTRTRYNLSTNHQDAYRVATIKDVDKIVFSTDKIPISKHYCDRSSEWENLPQDAKQKIISKVWDIEAGLKKEAEEWVEKNYPEWKDETKYWDVCDEQDDFDEDDFDVEELD